jgi:hypothetical protein
MHVMNFFLWKQIKIIVIVIDIVNWYVPIELRLGSAVLAHHNVNKTFY